VAVDKYPGDQAPGTINRVWLQYDILPNTSSLMACLARWSNAWPFSGASIKAIRTLISGFARIRTFIVSPSTMPVMCPGIDTWSRTKAYVAAGSGSRPKTARTLERIILAKIERARGAAAEHN